MERRQSMTLREFIDAITKSPLLLLLVMWLVLSAACVGLHFIPSDVDGPSAKDEIPKVLIDGWKFLTGATASALTTLVGKKYREDRKGNPSEVFSNKGS